MLQRPNDLLRVMGIHLASKRLDIESLLHTPVYRRAPASTPPAAQPPTPRSRRRQLHVAFLTSSQSRRHSGEARISVFRWCFCSPVEPSSCNRPTSPWQRCFGSNTSKGNGAEMGTTREFNETVRADL